MTVTPDFILDLFGRDAPSLDVLRLVEDRRIKLHVSDRLLDTALVLGSAAGLIDHEWAFQVVQLLRTVGEHPSARVHLAYGQPGSGSLAMDIVRMFVDECAKRADRTGDERDAQHIDFIIASEKSIEYSIQREAPFHEHVLWTTARRMYLLVLNPEDYPALVDPLDS